MRSQTNQSLIRPYLRSVSTFYTACACFPWTLLNALSCGVSSLYSTLCWLSRIIKCHHRPVSKPNETLCANSNAFPLFGSSRITSSRWRLILPSWFWAHLRSTSTSVQSLTLFSFFLRWNKALTHQVDQVRLKRFDVLEKVTPKNFWYRSQIRTWSSFDKAKCI